MLQGSMIVLAALAIAAAPAFAAPRRPGGGGVRHEAMSGGHGGGVGEPKL